MFDLTLTNLARIIIWIAFSVPWYIFDVFSALRVKKQEKIKLRAWLSTAYNCVCGRSLCRIPPLTGKKCELSFFRVFKFRGTFSWALPTSLLFLNASHSYCMDKVVQKLFITDTVALEDSLTSKFLFCLFYLMCDGWKNSSNKLGQLEGADSLLRVLLNISW